MAMKAQIRTDSQGNITIHMNGGLDYENSIPLRLELESLTKQNPASIITLDMHSLDFVGSSGIGIFVETLQILNKNKAQIKLSNVKTEFIKVFKLYNFDAFNLIVADFESDETENLNQKYGNRKNTFQN
jgi:anti-sigma B factor antagonist